MLLKQMYFETIAHFGGEIALSTSVSALSLNFYVLSFLLDRSGGPRLGAGVIEDSNKFKE